MPSVSLPDVPLPGDSTLGCQKQAMPAQDAAGLGGGFTRHAGDPCAVNQPFPRHQRRDQLDAGQIVRQPSLAGFECAHAFRMAHVGADLNGPAAGMRRIDDPARRLMIRYPNGAGGARRPWGGQLLSGVSAVWAGSDLDVGHDSGPMHLASGVGTPCVAIFSSRNLPGHWFPYGKSSHVVYHRCECQGCNLDVCTKNKKMCIGSITVGEVEDSVVDLVKKTVEQSVRERLTAIDC